MGKYEWIEMSDAKEMANEIINKYPDQFGHIEVTKIKFIGIMNKKKANDHAKIWSLQSVTEPLNIFFEIDVVASILLDYWSNMDYQHQALVIASMLDCLMFKERLFVRGYDVQDSRLMLGNFGLDYESNPDVPDIMNGNYNWRQI
jgi:hypothetical protein